MSVTTKYRGALSNAEMQLRAKRIAHQASKVAEQAGPMTKSVAMAAKYRAAGAAERATPYVTRTRRWMAVQANHGSISVRKTLGPKVSDMLATTARKLDPPADRVRRVPTALAGGAILAAGAAAAGAVKMKSRKEYVPPPMPPAPPGPADETTAFNPSVDSNGARQDTPFNP